jgi:TolB-like protein/Flp pilus assembly protein TadD
MKRCPECRRDYFDDTLLYCLDDGSALLEGPASADEPATAIMTSADSPSESPTKIQTETDKTAILPTSSDHPSKERPLYQKKHLLFAALGLLLVTGGFVAYRYLVTTDPTQIDSIAVLPFVNQTQDSDSDYLADGLTESIINNLTRVQSLRVIPRSSVFHYSGNETDPIAIGQNLKVRAVLTGRVTLRGDNLIVSTALVDVRDNKQIWGDQFNRKLGDALALQQEISREITDRLRLKLSGDEQQKFSRQGTSSPEAYQSYLKGRYYWNKRTAENTYKAMEQFHEASDRDPDYALAYVGLADCYTLLEQNAGLAAGETLPKARAFAERALQIDGSLSEARAALGNIDRGLWKWEDAEKEYQRAIEINPNYPSAHQWYGILLRQMGRLEDSMRETKRAQELDPLSPAVSDNVAINYLLRGDVNSCIEQSKMIIELDPGTWLGHNTLGLAYLRLGRYPEALFEINKAVELSARSGWNLSYLGTAYAISGDRSKALTIIKELEDRYASQKTGAQYIARIYAALGDSDDAFAWLEKDFQARSGFLADMVWFPSFDPLRTDPRYADLLRRMGLKP